MTVVAVTLTGPSGLRLRRVRLYWFWFPEAAAQAAVAAVHGRLIICLCKQPTHITLRLA